MEQNSKAESTLKNQHSTVLQFSRAQFSVARQASHQHILKKNQISKMHVLQDIQVSLGPHSKRKQSLPTQFSKKNISHAVNSSTITTDFNGATFENLADFRNAYFEGFSNFVNANFEGDTKFINTTFKIFDKLADFTDTKFIGSATFAKSIFFGPTCFHGARFINKEPRFGGQGSSLLAARFSCSVTPDSYIFDVSPHSPHKIRLGESELNGKNFIIPEGTMLFDPNSWDEEQQKYTRVSEPAKPIEDSNTEEEKPTE